jgi:hypothetical protein
MNPIITQLQTFCQTHNCRPADLFIQWSPAGGCVIAANTPTGIRLMPVVTHSLDLIAQALYLYTKSEPKVETQLPHLEPPKYHFPKVQEGNSEPATAPKDKLENKSWRNASKVEDIVGLFPKYPNADEILDLFQLNKTHNSPEIQQLLTKHSKSLGKNP